MQIAPDADPGDGLLSVVIVRALAKPRLVANLPSLYRGTHPAHPAVTVLSGKHLEATPLRVVPVTLGPPGPVTA